LIVLASAACSAAIAVWAWRALSAESAWVALGTGPSEPTSICFAFTEPGARRLPGIVPGRRRLPGSEPTASRLPGRDLTRIVRPSILVAASTVPPSATKRARHAISRAGEGKDGRLRFI